MSKCGAELRTDSDSGPAVTDVFLWSTDALSRWLAEKHTLDVGPRGKTM